MRLSEFLTNLQNVKGGPEHFTARCPAHEDSHNSLSISAGEDGRVLLKCHAGCETEAILDKLSMRAADLFAKAQPQVKRVRGETKLKVVGQSSALLGNIDEIQYTDDTQYTYNTYSLKDVDKAGDPAMKEDAQPKPIAQIVYPYEDADGQPLFEVVRYQYEDGSKTFRQRRRDGDGYVYKLGDTQTALYHLPQVRHCIEQGTGAIVVCEGEKDADALMALGITATTAPMGAGKWRTQYTDQLHDARHVYIIPDHDKPGRAHAVAVGQALAGAGIEVSIVDLPAVWPGLPRKGDISDVLEALGEAAIRPVFGQAVDLDTFTKIARERDEDEAQPPYTFDTAAAYVERDFREDLRRQRDGDAISTGFKALDAQLDNRLYPGLYVIGSVSSLGKTAFCLQMADHIARQRVDVLFFTLEMSRMEMVARSLVRDLLIRERGHGEYNIGHVLYGHIGGQQLDDALRIYGDTTGRNIAFIEGGFDVDVEHIASHARRHARSTGRRPVVFVDYLQILRPIDARMSDKQAVDYNVIALKRLSRELNIPVIAVSSFNRQNYTEEVNMAAFKESGAIEYSADFVMGLQARGVSAQADLRTDEKKAARMVMQETKRAKQMDPRPIEVVTLKNRRGPAWAKFELDFYPRQNLFLENGR